METRLDRRLLSQLVGSAPTIVCWSVVADTGFDVETIFARQFNTAGLGDASSLRLGVDIPLSDETSGLLVVLELPSRNLWGGVLVEQTEDLLPPPGPGAVRIPGAERAWYEVEAPLVRAKSGVGSASVVRLVPPRRQPATGSTRIYALISRTDIDKLTFELDGKPIGERRRQPFGITVELDSPPRPQSVRAVAYDRRGAILGEHVLELNVQDAPFRVRIGDFEGSPSDGAVTINADVTVPFGATLERVEVYRNEVLVTTETEPVIRARVATPNLAATDYVRIAATLTDGRTIDDVVLLASPGLTDQVDVNLVTVYSVVTDAAGRPIDDLDREAFTLRRGKKAVDIEGLSYADDVSLLLGLVIDTSNSMSLVMDDTRRAAARFLQDTIQEQDRGFVVDFDQQPRLLHDTTADVADLLGVLGRLEAKGLTSLYDAIVFSMLQFERQSGRKALVVLTDGADLDSRFGPKDCIAYGRRLGVPIYLLALDNQGISRFPERELRRIAQETGGDLLFADGIEQLAATYERINAELRSQYALTFYSADDLTEAERRAVAVSVSRAGARVRSVVGTGPTE